MISKLKVWIESNPIILKMVRMVYDNTLLKYNATKYSKNFKNYNAEALESLHQAFKEVDIDYWLDFGTLLGAVRENDFIPHDLDIDIGVLGVLSNEARSNIDEVLSKHGFEKKYFFMYENFVREETYAYKGISVDLFYYELDNKEITSYYFLPEKGKSREKTINDRGGLIPVEVKFPYIGLEKYTFLGIETYIPKNSIDYVVARYGKNYKEKVVDWDNMKSPKNIKVIEHGLGYYHIHE